MRVCVKSVCFNGLATLARVLGEAPAPPVTLIRNKSRIRENGWMD